MHYLHMDRSSLLTTCNFGCCEFLRKEAEGRSIHPLRTLQMTCDVCPQKLFLAGDILVIMNLT